MLTEQELMREAAETGFQKEPLEKMIRLSELLESLRSHPFLKPRITRNLVAECRDMLSLLLPLEPQEREFLDRLNDRGEIAPELLTDDAALQVILRSHPGLLWKALNVRKHQGLDDESTA
jgi:hypothetical protein